MIKLVEQLKSAPNGLADCNVNAIRIDRRLRRVELDLDLDVTPSMDSLRVWRRASLRLVGVLTVSIAPPCVTEFDRELGDLGDGEILTRAQCEEQFGQDVPRDAIGLTFFIGAANSTFECLAMDAELEWSELSTNPDA